MQGCHTSPQGEAVCVCVCVRAAWGLRQRAGWGSDSKFKQLRVQTAGGKPEQLRGGINPSQASWGDRRCKEKRQQTLCATMAAFKQLRRIKSPTQGQGHCVTSEEIHGLAQSHSTSDLQKLCLVVPYLMFTTPWCKLAVPNEPDEDGGTRLWRCPNFLHTDKIQISWKWRQCKTNPFILTNWIQTCGTTVFVLHLYRWYFWTNDETSFVSATKQTLNLQEESGNKNPAFKFYKLVFFTRPGVLTDKKKL